MRRLALSLWIASIVAFVGVSLWAWRVLPDPVVTHFGPGLAADGSTTPTADLVTSLATGLPTVVGMPLLMWVLARGEGVGVNIPRKDYWFAPERVDATRRALVTEMMFFTAGVGAFLTGMQVAVVVANRRTPPSLGPEFVVVIALLAVGTTAWIVYMLRRYGRPPETVEDGRGPESGGAVLR